jgi:hypothetical protein
MLHVHLRCLYLSQCTTRSKLEPTATAMDVGIRPRQVSWPLHAGLPPHVDYRLYQQVQMTQGSGLAGYCQTQLRCCRTPQQVWKPSSNTYTWYNTPGEWPTSQLHALPPPQVSGSA